MSNKKLHFFTVHHAHGTDIIIAEGWDITGGALVFYKNNMKGSSFGPSYWHVVRRADVTEVQYQLDELLAIKSPFPDTVRQIESIQATMVSEGWAK